MTALKPRRAPKSPRGSQTRGAGQKGLTASPGPSTGLFPLLCRAQGLPKPLAEYRFAREALGRQWRFDWAWPGAGGKIRFWSAGVALEIEGGIWARRGAKRCKVCGQTPVGRHATAKGMLADIEKYNAATEMGWRVLRCTPQTLTSPQTFDLLKRILG